MPSVLLSGNTLGESLANLAELAPRALASFPTAGDRITAARLHDAATDRATAFLSAGIEPNELVGVLVPTATTFFTTIFGLWRAGAAVSVLPLRTGFTGEAATARRLATIVRAAGMRHLVLGEDYAPLGATLRELVPELVVVDADTPGSGSGAALPEVRPEMLAVVQFTSGSTSRPKGVMLAHRTVLAGLRAVVVSSALSPEDVFVQWVPTFHDMGLIGLLSEWLNGADVHAFSPATFLRRPAEVLAYFARHRGTVFTGPDFSYRHLLDGITADQAAALDLSSWRLAFNGAEPVDAGTVARFTEALAPAGVRDSVMYPVYGMAEATLAISFPRPGDAPRLLTVSRTALATTGTVNAVPDDHPDAKTLVSAGRPVHGIALRVKGEDGTVLGDGRLGEIQISGDPVTTGYYREPAATAAAFDGGWLRTGDLGFTEAGHLYVAGRLKEMVVVHGQNFFPGDVEAIAREVPGVYRRRCVAFPDSDQDGAEHVGVIVEANAKTTDVAALRHEVARRVAAELALSQVRVHVVGPRWLSRTTSGKWQRLLSARRLAEEGERSG